MHFLEGRGHFLFLRTSPGPGTQKWLHECCCCHERSSIRRHFGFLLQGSWEAPRDQEHRTGSRVRGSRLPFLPRSPEGLSLGARGESVISRVRRVFWGQSLVWGLKVSFEGHQGYFSNPWGWLPKQEVQIDRWSHNLPPGLCMGLQNVGHDWATKHTQLWTNLNTFTYTQGEDDQTWCCCED